MTTFNANAVDAYHEHIRAQCPYLPGGKPMPEDMEGALRTAARENGCTVEDLRRWVKEDRK